VVASRSTSDAARAVIAQLPGWLISTDDLSLAGSLIKAGATPKRHAFVMQCDLRLHPGSALADDRFTPSPLPGRADAGAWASILPSWRAAFPRDHPDHFAGDDKTAVDFILRLVEGTELGPLHRSSTLLRGPDGRCTAGILVNVRPQEPPLGGAWIADVWRDPELRGTGVGGLLIQHAKRLLAEDGHVSLGLAVSAGNPAKGTYEAQGFRTVTQGHTLLLPG
jgi:ribosomal protein S18 acetylase RimI-like enzyme